MLALFPTVLAVAPFILMFFSMQQNFEFVGGTVDGLLDPLGLNVEFLPGVEHPSTLEIIDKHGYKGENHTVTTKDGYILEIHRILGPNRENNTINKPVVFVMPGILCSSSVWVLTIPEKSLAFLLADGGYDVWIGNARGTTYGRKHITLTVHDKKFWLFSFHEIGLYDVPAMIDYILQKTNQKKLLYVAHSQGSTAFYIMASMRPEYQDKVEAMFALAPVAYLTHGNSPLLLFVGKVIPELQTLTELISVYEVESHPELIKQILRIVCNSVRPRQTICAQIFYALAGFSPYQMNGTLLPIIIEHFPVGASLKQIWHFAQIWKFEKFQQYDYGAPENMKRYGEPEPPSYDLGSIKVPVHLHYSTNDLIADPTDVHRLHQELGNSVESHVTDDTFNHFDFLWGIGAKTLVYDNVLNSISKYKIK